MELLSYCLDQTWWTPCSWPSENPNIDFDLPMLFVFLFKIFYQFLLSFSNTYKSHGLFRQFKLGKTLENHESPGLIMGKYGQTCWGHQSQPAK